MQTAPDWLGVNDYSSQVMGTWGLGVVRYIILFIFVCVKNKEMNGVNWPGQLEGESGSYGTSPATGPRMESEL